jgi:drug/metabolite transporter (DMT)-like permease
MKRGAGWATALALGGIYLSWGSTYLAIRYAVETLPPFLLAGARFLVSGSVFYAWARMAGNPAPTRRQWVGSAIAGFLLIVSGHGLVVWGEKTVPSGLTALLIGTTPVVMVLFEWLGRGGKRPGGAGLAGVATGFAGVVVLLRPGGDAADPFGVALILVAVVSWVVGSLNSRTAGLPKSALMKTAAQMLCAGAVLAVLSPAIGEWRALDSSQVSARSVLAVAYLTVVGGAGFVCYSWLLHNTTPVLSTTYAYVNPLIAVVLGWRLGGEAITGRILAATPLVLAGVVLISLAGKGRRG